jgi:hypothetical protein
MEIFKQHKSGYFVSNKGRIKGKVIEYLNPTLSSSGYLTVRNNTVHRIVVETFIGEIPKNYEVNHIDGCKTNNNLENLEIVTSSQNQIHAYKIGLQKGKKGEENPMSTITEEEVLDIYEMFKKGLTNKDVSNKYFLHDRYVSLIRHGKRWKYLWVEHFNNNNKINSLGSCSLPLDKMLEIIHLTINTEKTNQEIADLYHLEKSSISRIRNKISWKEVWRHYYNNLSIATTIENTNK